MRNPIISLAPAFAAMMLLAVSFSNAQVGNVTEDDQVKQAGKYFESKDYEQALPLFSQIVSNKPDDAYYNYCLGVCLLKVDGDKADAVRFLTTATQSSGVPLNAWLYLGMALHHAYRYEESIVAVKVFKASAGKQAWKESGGEQLIHMCQNAINLNNDLSLLRHSILEEQEINCNDFFMGYKDISTAGRFLKLPKEYEQRQTKGSSEGSLLFLNAKGDEMVFAGQGKNAASGLDIFKVVKGRNGIWMSPEPISPVVNSNSDEAFPVLVNDGKTLFFSSRGDKSTGGYDVFKSELDAATGTWSEPVSMGSPVNSPGDDYYYVPLADQKTAYFSSDRESPSGKCKVYTASIIKEFRNFVTVNGTFNCPSALELSEAKVTVLNAGDRSLMAQFRTASQNGTYFMKLPVPSKLIYQVKLPGFNDREAEVDMGHIQATHLIQEISVLKDAAGKVTLLITNRIPDDTPKTVMNPQTNPVISAENKNVETGNQNTPDANDELPLVSIVSIKNPVVEKSDSKIKGTAPSGNTPLNHPASVNAATEKVQLQNENILPADITKSDTKVASEIENLQVVLVAAKVNHESNNVQTGIEKSEMPSVVPQTGFNGQGVTQTNEDKLPVQKKQEVNDAAENANRKTQEITTAVIPANETGNESSEVVVNKTTSSIMLRQTQPAIPLNAKIPVDPLVTAMKQDSGIQNKETVLTVTQVVEVTPESSLTAIKPPGQGENELLKNVVFKVQLGAFRDHSEKDVKKKFEASGLTDLEFSRNGAGVLLVLTGNETDYESASNLKEYAVQHGITDAFVVVYSGEKRLPVQLVVSTEE